MSNNISVEKANEKTLVYFEEAVDRGDFRKAEELLQTVLLHLNVNHSFSKTTNEGINLLPFSNTISDEDRFKFYKLVADKITELFLNDDYEMSDFGYQVFNIFKSQLMWLYIAAGYPNLDFIIVNKGIIDPTNGDDFNLQNEHHLKLLLTCYTIESDLSLDFSMLYEHYPMLASYAYVGCFYYSNIVLNNKSENCLRKLIPLCHIFERLPLDNTLLVLSSNVWMTCTYMNATEKHKIKESINKYYLRYLSENLSKNTKKELRKYLLNYKKSNNRQKLVVCAEILSVDHAMLRCYKEALIALSNNFDTVLIVSENAIDKNINPYFSKVIEIEDKVFGQHDKIVNLILKESPDIIYYPSLGMACWTLPLCNLRLAPVQIMSLGHPASSMSKNIDYYLTDEDSRDFLLETSEAPHIIPNNHIYTPREFDVESAKPVTRSEDEVHIAINCKDFKIRSVFIDTCRELSNASSKKCVFHFFPNAKGLMRDCFHNLLKPIIPHYKVHKVANYQDYMTQLSECDLSLSTFPFGGSNSNVDAFLLGMPRVILVSEGPEASADLTQARQINLPDWLITDDIEQYFLAALALIESSELREEISNTIKASKPEQIFFNKESNSNQNIYPDAFSNIYKNHRFDSKKKYNRAVCYK